MIVEPQVSGGARSREPRATVPHALSIHCRLTIPWRHSESAAPRLEDATRVAVRQRRLRSNPLKELLTGCQDLVQRFLKVGRRFRKLASDLIHIFLIALLDLFAKQILERTIAKSFGATIGKVGDEIGNERP